MHFRQTASVVVAAVGGEAALSVADADHSDRGRQIVRVVGPALPSPAHVLALLLGSALVVLAPRLWAGTRTAVWLAVGALWALAALKLSTGSSDAMPALCAGVALVLAAAHGAFRTGCRNRSGYAAVSAAAAAWAITYCVIRLAPLVSDRGHSLSRALHATLGPHGPSAAWVAFVETLIAAALAISLMAVRSVLRPVDAASGHAEEEYRTARELVERYGRDSLAPFILRSDKAFHFAGGAVLAYRLVGETAIVSGDPVGPPGSEALAVSSFLELATRRGWSVVLWACSDRLLGVYRRLGMRAICVGEEAYVAPESFALAGRAVRKLRQSVHRAARRGWQLSAVDGRELNDALEAEVDALSARWRRERRRIVGFAMGMGGCDPDRRPDDTYLLARAPNGELRAVMRFVTYDGGVSLDTMHRVGEMPNGINEALVCVGLSLARSRGIAEMSLNYAGLAHLVRRAQGDGRPLSPIMRASLHLLGRRFQMARLVRFNDKFSPEWRPRYLVYRSRAGLPRSIVRVLQVEGYLPQPRWAPPRRATAWVPRLQRGTYAGRAAR